VVKTPLGKLGDIKGRDMPERFSIDEIVTGRHFVRTVDGQGRISINRYRLYVDFDLSKQKVEIKAEIDACINFCEFLTSLVVVYQSGAVVTYRYTETDAEEQPIEIENAPVFHSNRAIERSLQLEFFDLTDFSSQLRYVTKRQKNRRRKRIRPDAIQLSIDFSV
jgi:hypothetical protein